MREIAAEAQIDPALIIRYFGSKDRLFAEAAEFRLNLPSLDGVPHDKIGETLVRHFIGVWEGEAGTGGLPILLRSATSSEAAAEQMREIFRGRCCRRSGRSAAAAAPASGRRWSRASCWAWRSAVTS